MLPSSLGTEWSRSSGLEKAIASYLMDMRDILVFRAATPNQ